MRTRKRGERENTRTRKQENTRIRKQENMRARGQENKDATQHPRAGKKGRGGLQEEAARLVIVLVRVASNQ